jgi:lipopolysaccharide heptosyltransferase II
VSRCLLLTAARPPFPGTDGMTTSPWAQAHRILCIRLDYMGDVLMCTPALRALRESGLGAPRHIALLTAPQSVAVAGHIPEVDQVIPYAAPWMKASAPQSPADTLAMAERLRRACFDAAVIFTTYSQSPLPAALMCQLAGIPLRLAHCHENPYQLLTHWVADPEPSQVVRHEVRRQLDLVASIGCQSENQRLSFRVDAKDADWAASWLHSAGIDRARGWVLLHPGATASSRRYPPRHWARLSAMLTQQLGCTVVLSGTADEADLIETIRRAAPGNTHSLAGKLSLGQLGALIEAAPVMVANNTGPAHIAAAVGTPIVDLYALTNPQHTPWLVRSHVLFHPVPCRNCYRSVCPEAHHDCLEKVAPERVLAAVVDLLTPSVAPLPATVLAGVDA